MNSKIYVSLKTARLLKEKGYNKETIFYYDCAGKLYLGNGHFNHNIYGITLSAPTKAEAIDWLERKGIVVVTQAFNVLKEDSTLRILWCSSIMIEKTQQYYYTENFQTRLGAENAAIIKALKLL